ACPCMFRVSAGSIKEIGLTLRQKCRHNQNQHHQEHRDAQFHDMFADTINTWHEWSVLCFINPFIQHQRQSREENHDTDKAEQDPFHQVQTQVSAKSEFHKRQGCKSEERC